MVKNPSHETNPDEFVFLGLTVLNLDSILEIVLIELSNNNSKVTKEHIDYIRRRVKEGDAGEFGKLLEEFSNKYSYQTLGPFFHCLTRRALMLITKPVKEPKPSCFFIFENMEAAFISLLCGLTGFVLAFITFCLLTPSDLEKKDLRNDNRQLKVTVSNLEKDLTKVKSDFALKSKLHDTTVTSANNEIAQLKKDQKRQKNEHAKKIAKALSDTIAHDSSTNKQSAELKRKIAIRNTEVEKLKAELAKQVKSSNNAIDSLELQIAEMKKEFSVDFSKLREAKYDLVSGSYQNIAAVINIIGNPKDEDAMAIWKKLPLKAQDSIREKLLENTKNKDQLDALEKIEKRWQELSIKVKTQVIKKNAGVKI